MRWLGKLIYVTREEHDWLHEQRRKAMADYCGVRVPASGRYPWRDITVRGALSVSGRDRNRDLLASVRIWNGSDPTRYVRRLRCPQGLSRTSDRVVPVALTRKV